MTDRMKGSENEHQRDAGAKSARELGMLLVCFKARKQAGSVRRRIEKQQRSGADMPLDTVVLQVNEKGHVSVHDPRRVVQGTLTAFLTWGAFGLVAGGLRGLAIWAILGAICGGLYAFYSEHLLNKNELARIGTQLPANSSLLLVTSETSDARRLLAETAVHDPTAASAILVADDLSARSFAGADDPRELPHVALGSVHAPSRSAPLSMILLRYGEPKTAATVAHAMRPKSKKDPRPIQVELVIRVDQNGHRHVSDPSQGAEAWAKSDIVSWGLFGVVVGALAGAFGGGGVHAFVDQGIVTGIGWAVFGLVAGALYGLWAGRAVSARRLKGLRGLLVPGTSYLVAWVEGSAPSDKLADLSKAASGELVVNFNPVAGGALLEAA
jgi:uncharacterized membrane protein